MTKLLNGKKNSGETRIHQQLFFAVFGISGLVEEAGTCLLVSTQGQLWKPQVFEAKGSECRIKQWGHPKRSLNKGGGVEFLVFWKGGGKFGALLIGPGLKVSRRQPLKIQHFQPSAKPEVTG